MLICLPNLEVLVEDVSLFGKKVNNKEHNQRDTASGKKLFAQGRDTLPQYIYTVSNSPATKQINIMTLSKTLRYILCGSNSEIEGSETEYIPIIREPVISQPNTAGQGIHCEQARNAGSHLPRSSSYQHSRSPHLSRYHKAMMQLDCILDNYHTGIMGPCLVYRGICPPYPPYEYWTFPELKRMLEKDFLQAIQRVDCECSGEVRARADNMTEQGFREIYALNMEYMRRQGREMEHLLSLSQQLKTRRSPPRKRLKKVRPMQH
ncbi:hypothetical protein B0O99DRAFT_300124 [Bisporella sp. PMI_857]|nr:hypothetical protein B0O99DRAFT_300124 [Bisporella sp. PMI_857]